MGYPSFAEKASVSPRSAAETLTSVLSPQGPTWSGPCPCLQPHLLDPSICFRNTPCLYLHTHIFCFVLTLCLCLCSTPSPGINNQSSCTMNYHYQSMSFFLIRRQALSWAKTLYSSFLATAFSSVPNIQWALGNCWLNIWIYRSQDFPYLDKCMGE